MSSGHSLRNYQVDGISAIQQSWAENKRPMVAVATGGGKTVMIAQLLKQTISSSDRALVIAHTEEIVQQIHSTISLQYGSKSVGIVMGRYNGTDSQIIVATRQSLTRKRLATILEYGDFKVVVIDEAHHATLDNTYGQIVKAILNVNRKTKVVGFTATPDRETGQSDLFDKIVFSWSIPDGVKSGFLVPARQINIRAESLNNPNIIRNILDCDNWLDLTIEAYKTYIYSAKRPCLAFFPSISMSVQFTTALRQLGLSAAHIDGYTPKLERESILAAYKKGEIKVVSNMEVLTEGFDAPNTSAILLVRPTQSKTLLTQILGRGLRPAQGKKDCLIVNLALNQENLKFNDILGYKYSGKNNNRIKYS